MKKALRSSLLAASALLISFGLSSCGSGNPTPFAGSTTSFAYLQESSVSATKVPAVAGRAHELNPRRARVHEARPRISNMGTGINLGAGNIDLYVMDSATGATTKLNPTSAAFMSAKLSVDGTKLVFSAEDTSGYLQVFVADAKLQTITQLTGLTPADESDHANAAFSADGKTVVFDTMNGGQIYTIPATGGTPTLIATQVFGVFPIFTPNGKSIVFEGDSTSSDTYAIFSVNLDGSALTQLTLPTLGDFLPSVSPDGSSVAFERITEITENITYYVADIAVISINGESTTNPAKLLTSGDYSAGWSNQALYLGTEVLFVCQPGTATVSSIYEVNADGSKVAQLTTTTAATAFNATRWEE